MKADSQYTEDQIIRGCVKGDRVMQKALYDRFAPVMYPVCVRYVGREVGKDVLQDGFLTAFDKIGSYRGEGSFEGWLRRIFVTTALMQLRKNDVLRETEELEVALPEAGSKESGALDIIAAKELLDLISTMPAGLRSVFNLFVIEGYSHQDISDLLGITPLSSRSQLSRARVWLQKKITDLNYDR